MTPVEHLFSAIWLNHNPSKKYVLMATTYTVYSDASGHPADSAVLIVAGFVSRADKWLRFESQWGRLLQDFNVSCFHMKEFTQRIGQFAGWDVTRQTDFLSRAIPLIKATTHKSFSSGVVVKDLLRLHTEYSIPDHLELNSPYGWCAMNMIRLVTEWMRRNLVAHDPVRFVFEDGDLDRGKFLIRAKDVYGFSPSFENKKSCLPLQIADFVAWEHRRFSMDKEQGKRSPLRRSFVSLFRQIPHDGSWSFTRWKSIEKGCQLLGIPKRSESDVHSLTSRRKNSVE